MFNQKLSPKRIVFAMAGVMLSLLLAALDNTIKGIIYKKKYIDYN